MSLSLSSIPCNIISKPVLSVNILQVYNIYLQLLLPYAISPMFYLHLPPPKMLKNNN